MSILTLREIVIVDGWTLFVETHGGYSRSGDDYRTEISWTVGNRRVFIRPQMVINHPHAAEAEMVHEEVMLDLRGGAYELKFYRGQVTLIRVPLWKYLMRLVTGVLRARITKREPPKPVIS